MGRRRCAASGPCRRRRRGNTSGTLLGTAIGRSVSQRSSIHWSFVPTVQAVGIDRSKAHDGKRAQPVLQQILARRGAQSKVPKGRAQHQLQMLQVTDAVQQPGAFQRDDAQGLLPLCELAVAPEVEQPVLAEHEEASLPHVKKPAEVLFRPQLIEAAHHARPLREAGGVFQHSPLVDGEHGGGPLLQQLRSQHDAARARHVPR
jgi:hypothetical protein